MATYERRGETYYVTYMSRHERKGLKILYTLIGVEPELSSPHRLGPRFLKFS